NGAAGRSLGEHAKSRIPLQWDRWATGIARPGYFRAALDHPHDLGGLAPQALEAVVLALLGGEDVDDDRAVVQEHPARRRLALDPERLDAVVAQLVDDGAREGLDLAVGSAGADDE